MFASARAKLTLWYLLLIVMISGTLSLLFYFRTAAILHLEYERIDQRFQRDINELSEPLKQRALAARRINVEDLQAIERAMVLQLLVINAAIVVVFAVGGYVLSGFTLQPIQEAHEEQRRFVGDAAHELKTPITALKTTLEVNLMDEKLSAQTKHILRENLEDVSNLEALSESLLRLAKVSDQALQLTKLELKKPVMGAIKFLSVRAKQRKIKLAVEFKKLPLNILADQGAILDLCIILLDNAIKYSPDKSHILITADRKGRSAILTISDQGFGISKQHLPHIFERFYRADSVRNVSAHKGYGLGLAVAKKIVQQHHGFIQVKSQENKGTTFVIGLPLA
jgi:signal transduction histidine kinase